MSFLLQQLEDVKDAALVWFDGIAVLVVGLAIVLDEFVRFFVDSVVGEVHEEVMLVVFIGFLVFVGRESHQPVLVKENLQRISRGYQDIEPQIELEPIDKQRLGEILLNQQISSIDNIMVVGNDPDALSLTRIGRFYDIGLI